MISYPIALLLLFTSLFLLTFLIYLYRAYRRRRLLAALQTMPFPGAWRGYLQQTVHYPRLSAQEREPLERALLRFVQTHTFRGVGVEVTDEMKAVIGFYAVLMVRSRPDYDYPTLNTVIFYADEFVVDEFHEDGGIVSEAPDAVLDGQSSEDTVVLSCHDALYEAYHPSEYNVIIHEFAHLLDFEDGLSDGLPPLPKIKAEVWDLHFTEAFDDLEKALVHGPFSQKHQLLGEYAATNRAEFFAVASERYFMQPNALRHHYPRLFTLLTDYYG